MFALTVAGVAAMIGAGVVSAAPNPTEPSSTSVFNVGSQCTIKWDADSTGNWKKMNIQLMTGDNWNMIHITTVAQNIDATDATKNTYSYTCPDVTPTSAIYFYQFSSEDDPKNLLWTTRWTLASADGSTTPPTETTQPDGQSIPWGKGALVDPSTAVPAPAYLTGAGSTNATTTAAGGSSTAAGSATTSAAAGTSAGAGAATTEASATGSTSRSSTARAGAAATSGSSTASASTAAATANGAVGVAIPGVMTVFGAMLAAVGLF